MVRNISLLFIFCFLKSQVSFHESWAGYALQTYTTSNTVSSYTLPHNGWQVFSDGLPNATEGTLNPNVPFHDPVLKNTAFVLYFDPEENDTILVSTSWIDSTNYSIDRWIISPTLQVYQPTSVFSWKARSPDPSYRDGYSLYILPSTLTVSHPSQITQSYSPVFSVPDNNTTGGGEYTRWIQRAVDISPYFMQGFRFAVRHQSKNRYQLRMDDFMVIGVSYSLDASCSFPVVRRALSVGASDSVRVNVKSLSSVSIQTLSLGYRINNSSPYVQTFTLNNTPMYYENEKVFSFSLPFNYSSAGTYTLKTWIQSVNLSADQNPSNDTAIAYIYVLSPGYSRTSLAEISMSARQKESPIMMQYLLQCVSDSIIPLCLHHSDSLEKPESSLWHSAFSARTTDFVLNRTYDFQSLAFARNPTKYCAPSGASLGPSPISVSFTSMQYNSATREIQAVVEASCAASLWGDFRVHVFLTENNISFANNDSSDNGFNQWNGQYTVPWSLWHQKGYWISAVNAYIMNAWQYKHHFVFRKNLTPWAGQTGVIPGNGTSAGNVYTMAVTYTLPPSPAHALINQAENTHLVAFVEEVYTDTRNNCVWNATTGKIWNVPEVVGMRENQKVMADVIAFPNPFESKFFVDLWHLPNRIVITDIQGRPVPSGITRLSEKHYLIEVGNDVPVGVYILQVTTDGGQKGYYRIIKGRY